MAEKHILTDGILNDHAELYMIEVRGVRGWETIGDVALAPDMLPIVIGEAECLSE
ncbi:hypothetical protein [Sulfobacillus thermotolerans]|uniref:hypothetical protein n=1 Tax=Sulfobacillus thermotolerans TaxID=338644 RepID=UPI00336773D3